MPREQREQKDMTGVLFDNDRKESDKHPDYRGSATIDGVEYWVSAWENESRDGLLYKSLAFTPKDEEDERPRGRLREPERRRRDPSQRPRRRDDDEDDRPKSRRARDDDDDRRDDPPKRRDDDDRYARPSRGGVRSTSERRRDEPRDPDLDREPRDIPF